MVVAEKLEKRLRRESSAWGEMRVRVEPWATNRAGRDGL